MMPKDMKKPGDRPGPPQGMGSMGNGVSKQEMKQKMEKGELPAFMQGDESENEKRIWIKENDIIRPARVEVGITDGTTMEIISGIEEGQEVVLAMEELSKAETKKSDSEVATSPFMPKRPGKNKR